MNASANAHAVSFANLEKLEPDLAEGSAGEIDTRNTQSQHRDHEMSESREPEPELVGGHPARAGAISKEVLLRLLDAVFHFSAGAVASRRARELQSVLRAHRVSLQRAAKPPRRALCGARPCGKGRGNHKARIGPFVEDLALPPGARGSSSCACDTQSPQSGGKALGSLQTGSPCEALRSICPGGRSVACCALIPSSRAPVIFAPRHDLLAGEAAVGPHNDAHLPPKALANGARDFP